MTSQGNKIDQLIKAGWKKSSDLETATKFV